jgi:hypothetical protein
MRLRLATTLAPELRSRIPELAFAISSDFASRATPNFPSSWSDACVVSSRPRTP